MKQKLINLLLVSLFLTVLLSCKSGSQSETDTLDFDNINLNENRKVIISFDTIGEGLPIFYNMYLSVEMSSLFESIGAVFNSDLLNPTLKIPEYITSSKKALNPVKMKSTTTQGREALSYEQRKGYRKW